ncbi:MAG: TolC family protein [Spirochaetes bacterium]|nr:MAG: TolC family protein [Spirochaetota bacterium]
MRDRYKIAALCAILVLAMGTLASRTRADESAAPQKISLEEARRVALESNRDHRIASLKLREAEERVGGVWGQLIPVLESEASLQRQYAESGAMSLSDGQYDLRFVQLKFGINPGMFYNSLQLSRKALIVAREEARRIKAEIEYNVIKSYFNLLLAGEVITLRKESRELLKNNLKDVENLFRTGSVPRFELLQAQVQYQGQEPLLLEAENAWRVCLDTFNYHLGAEGDRYAADDSVLKRDEFRLPAGDARVKTGRLVRAGLKNRPEVIQLQKKREMAENAEGIQDAYYLWPTFTIGGSYGMTKLLPNAPDLAIQVGPNTITPDMSSITGTSDWQNTWQVRVAATYRWGALNPWDSTRAAGREEELKVREAEDELAKIRALVGISVSASYSRLVTSYHTIRSQRENVATAEEGLRIAKESYRAGVIKNAELLSAELALTNARTGYINSVNSYFTSLAELKREIGTDDEKIIMEDAQ